MMCIKLCLKYTIVGGNSPKVFKDILLSLQKRYIDPQPPKIILLIFTLKYWKKMLFVYSQTLYVKYIFRYIFLLF